MSDNEIRDMLAVDPLAEAERITGASYKEDKGTAALGFLMHLSHSDRKRAALEAAQDTHCGISLVGVLAVFGDLGFEQVLCDEFTGTSYSDEPAPVETFRILWHADGILATVESYNGDGLNMAKVYYNVRFREGVDVFAYTSSGGMRDGVWVGDHDAREGVRANLAGLREAGEFLPAWVERPWLWLLTYADTKVDGYDYEAINAERISRLPQHVQDAIGGAS